MFATSMLASSRRAARGPLALSSLALLAACALTPSARAQFERPYSPVLHVQVGDAPRDDPRHQAPHATKLLRDPDDVRSWRRLARARNWQSRAFAMHGLARFGERDAVLRALRDRHPHVRRAACDAVGARGGDVAARAVAPLVRDTDRDVREAAARALGWLRARSDVAVRALLAASADPFAHVRTQAAISLGELRGGAHDARVVERLADMLRESNVFVRDAATRSLAWTLRDAPALAPRLTRLLSVTDWRVRLAACHALGACVDGAPDAPGTERARRALRDAARHDKFWRVRNAAALALAGPRD